MNRNISNGMTTAMSEDARNELAGKLAATALDSGDGYIWAASTLVQAAASILITNMETSAAAKMIANLGSYMGESISENLVPSGSIQ